MNLLLLWSLRLCAIIFREGESTADYTLQGWDISAKKWFLTFEAENWVLGFVQICNKNGEGVNNTGTASLPGSKISRHDPSMPHANLIPFPARVPMQLQPVHAYWSWFKNGIQVSPHKLTWFRRLRRWPRASESSWIAARLDDMPKYGSDYYVSFTMFWRALISLVCIRDAGVPYHFCHSVEDEDRYGMRDRRGSFVSIENCQILAWNAGKSCVRSILDSEKFSGEGTSSRSSPSPRSRFALDARFGRDY
jgi:hypothetical protein